MVRCPLFKVPMFLKLNATDTGMDATRSVLTRAHLVLCRLYSQFHLFKFHLYNKLPGRPRGPTRVGFLETSSSVPTEFDGLFVRLIPGSETGDRLIRRGEGGGGWKGGPSLAPRGGGVSAFPLLNFTAQLRNLRFPPP